MNVLRDMCAGNRAPGWAIVGGLALMIVCLIIFPGGWAIGRADPLDFHATIQSMTDNDNLTHALSFVIILSSLSVAYGIFSFWRLSGPAGSLGHSLLRFGILVNLFHYGIYIMTFGMRHLLVAVSQHRDALSEFAAPEQADMLMLVLHATSGGLHFGFVTVSSISGILVGIGLARRYGSLGLTAAACWAFALAGVAGLVNVVVGQQAEIGPEAFIMASNIVLFVAAVALLVIGVGVLRGESELIPEESDG